MPSITRRDLLSSGLVLSASSLLARSAFGRAALWAGYPGDASAEALAAVAPREQLLFDFGWKFRFGHLSDPARDLNFGLGTGDFAKTGEFDFAKSGFDDSSWRRLNLPHDWAVELPFVRDDVESPNGDKSTFLHGSKPLGRRFPETSVAWYRREFEIPATDKGRRITVGFDGAFRSVLIFVNGCFIGRNDNGYAPFSFDITDFLAVGERTTSLPASMPASATDGFTRGRASIAMCGSPRQMRCTWASGTVRSALPSKTTRRPSRSTPSSKTRATKLRLPGSPGRFSMPPAKPSPPLRLRRNPSPWTHASVSRPRLRLPIPPCGRSIRPISTRPSSPLKSMALPAMPSASASASARSSSTPPRGCFLNGKSIKMQGTCNHQDHAGVGAAIPDQLAVVPSRRSPPDGLQRCPHLPQHAHSHLGRRLRPHGHDDDVRDPPDEFKPRRPGAA